MTEIKAPKPKGIGYYDIHEMSKELASERMFSHILLASVLVLMIGMIWLVFLYGKERFENTMSAYDCVFEQLIQSDEGR